MSTDLELMKEIVGSLKTQNQALTALLKSKGGALEKTAGTAHDALRLHGQTGLLSTPGLERDILTAYVRPHGIHQYLPSYPSADEMPRYGTITGFTTTTGSQPTNACADAPKGYMKGCNLTARYGLKRFDTHTIEMDKVMLRINRGDFSDLIMHGQLLSDMGLRPNNLNQDQVLNVLTMAEMIIAGHNMELELGKDIWQGVVAAGSTQFPGLDVQIATGHVDADTNAACSALDSDIKDFAWADVGGTTRDIVEYLSSLVYYLEYNAKAQGLDPVTFIICMRDNLWFELSAVWPCSYLTNRCRNSSGTNVAVINDNVNMAERVRMRNDMVIPINGRDYPVVTDTGIYEYANGLGGSGSNLKAGEYASSIYVVPLTVRGNMPVTYMNYIDYRLAGDDTRLQNGREAYWWTDDGKFSWSTTNIRWCYDLALKTEQRIVLRAPWLAGKLQRVKYTPLQHLREPDPSSPYNQDGGVSARNTTAGYAVWNTGRI